MKTIMRMLLLLALGAVSGVNATSCMDCYHDCEEDALSCRAVFDESCRESAGNGPGSVRRYHNCINEICGPRSYMCRSACLSTHCN